MCARQVNIFVNCCWCAVLHNYFSLYQHTLVHLQPVGASVKTQLELHTILTHDTGLCEVGRFTVLPGSGSIVVLGKVAENTPWSIYQYRLTGGHLQMLRNVQHPCGHGYAITVLGVTVQEEDFLAVTCSECGDTKLMSLKTGEINVAYRSRQGPTGLCHGDTNKVWLHCEDDLSVRELNCSSRNFFETGRKVQGSKKAYLRGYLPLPESAVVLGHIQWMEAVSCETGKQLWRLGGEVDGKKIDLWGVTFHPELRLLLAADHYNKILVLDPGTGSLVQTFPSPHPRFFCWTQGRLVLRHHSEEKHITHLQLVDPQKGTNNIGQKI